MSPGAGTTDPKQTTLPGLEWSAADGGSDSGWRSTCCAAAERRSDRC